MKLKLSLIAQKIFECDIKSRYKNTQNAVSSFFQNFQRKIQIHQLLKKLTRIVKNPINLFKTKKNKLHSFENYYFQKMFE